MEVIAFMIIVGIFGMLAGGILMYGRGAINYGIKKELREFADTYTEILNEYYKDVDEKGLLEAGVNGMVNYLGDPYSVFMDKETSTAFNEKVNGEYVVDNNGNIVIEKVLSFIFDDIRLENLKIGNDLKSNVEYNIYNKKYNLQFNTIDKNKEMGTISSTEAFDLKALTTLLYMKIYSKYKELEEFTMRLCDQSLELPSDKYEKTVEELQDEVTQMRTENEQLRSIINELQQQISLLKKK